MWLIVAKKVFKKSYCRVHYLGTHQKRANGFWWLQVSPAYAIDGRFRFGRSRGSSSSKDTSFICWCRRFARPSFTVTPSSAFGVLLATVADTLVVDGDGCRFFSNQAFTCASVCPSLSANCAMSRDDGLLFDANSASSAARSDWLNTAISFCGQLGESDEAGATTGRYFWRSLLQKMIWHSTSADGWDVAGPEVEMIWHSISSEGWDAGKPERVDAWGPSREIPWGSSQEDPWVSEQKPMWLCMSTDGLDVREHGEQTRSTEGLKTGGSLLEDDWGSLLEEAGGSLREDSWTSSQEDAWGSSKEEACGSSRKDTGGSSKEEACGSSQNDTGGSLTGDAWGSLREDAWGSCHTSGPLPETTSCPVSPSNSPDPWGKMDSGSVVSLDGDSGRETEGGGLECRATVGWSFRGRLRSAAVKNIGESSPSSSISSIDVSALRAR